MTLSVGEQLGTFYSITSVQILKPHHTLHFFFFFFPKLVMGHGFESKECRHEKSSSLRSGMDVSLNYSRKVLRESALILISLDYAI